MDDLPIKKEKLPIRRKIGDKKGDRSYFQWKDEQDKCLLNLLIEYINEGRRLSDDTFPKDVWENVIARFNQEMGVHLDRDNIRYRIRQLKKSYSIFKALKDVSGFGWDEVNKKVVASKDQWIEYIKSHPEAKEYQHKGIEYWDELCIFLGNSTATGEHSVTNKENRFNIEDDIMIPDITIDDVEIIPDDNEYRQAESSNKKKQKSTNASNPGRKNIGEGKEEVLMLIDAIENFQDKKYQKKAEYEGHNWLAALNKIPDLDMNLKLCASQYMTSSEIKLHFISMSLEERRAWLVLMSDKSQIG